MRWKNAAAISFSVASVIWLTAVSFIVVHAISRPAPAGLPVKLLRIGVSSARPSGIQPILVELRFAPKSSRLNLSVGSRLVRWEDFDAVIRWEVRQRPLDWPVYLAADRQIDWNVVAKTIDRIRGAPAEVVLLTSGKTASGKLVNFSK